MSVAFVIHGRYGPGDWIDDYEVQAFIEEHEFGESYDVVGRRGDRGRIKLFFDLARCEALEALYAELDVYGLHHRNILPRLRVRPSAKQLYIVTPFCELMTLAEWLRTRRSFEKEDAFAILDQLSDALEYLHRHELVLCELNPDKIVVLHPGAPMMVQIRDFTGVRRAGCEQRRGHATPTPYRAPELMRARAVAEPSRDIFSLAAIVSIVLTGIPPARREGSFEWDLRLIEKCAPELAPLLAKMLHDDPAERPLAATVSKWVAPLVETYPLIPPRETQITK